MLNIEQFLVQQKYFYFLAYFVKMTHFFKDLVQTRKQSILSKLGGITKALCCYETSNNAKKITARKKMQQSGA